MSLTLVPPDMNTKWEEVKKHYEASYRVKFKYRFADSLIEELWQHMQKLNATAWRYKIDPNK